MTGERGLGGDSVKGEDVQVDRWIGYGQCALDNNLGNETTQVDRMDIGRAGETTEIGCIIVETTSGARHR